MRLVTSRGNQKSTRKKGSPRWKWWKGKLAQDVRTNAINGHKCGSLVLTYWRKFVVLNIWRSRRQYDRNAKSLWRLRKTKGKNGCIQKEDIHKSYKSRRNDFCGHDWSIPINLNWQPLMDLRSRWIHPLSLELLYEDKIRTTEENERFLINDVTWYSR